MRTEADTFHVRSAMRTEGGPKMVGRIPMRTEPAKNRPYMSGKILPFWIEHCSALSSVLV